MFLTYLWTWEVHCRLSSVEHRARSRVHGVLVDARCLLKVVCKVRGSDADCTWVRCTLLLYPGNLEDQKRLSLPRDTSTQTHKQMLRHTHIPESDQGWYLSPP